MPLPKDVSAVLFDFDQTLIHLGADWEGLRTSVMNIAKRYGESFEDKWVLRGIGKAFKHLTDEGRESDAAKFRDEAFQCVEDEENRALAHSHPIMRATEVVAELRSRGYKVAIVSNNNTTSIKKALEMFGFPPIELIIGRHNGDPVKPSPIPVHKALTNLHIKPGQAILIGDGEADLAAGKAAGVATVLYAPPGVEKELQTKPIETVDDLGKLLDMLPAKSRGGAKPSKAAEAAT